MPIDLGATAISGAYRGATAAQAVYLGSTLVFSAKANYSDNFNRADNATSLGGSWVAGSDVLGIKSNGAYPVTSINSRYPSAYWNTPLLTDDQQVDITLGAQGAGSSGWVLAILGGDTSGHAMGAHWNSAGQALITLFTHAWDTAQTNAGQTTTLTGQSFLTGDVLTFKRVGNVYTTYRNGSLQQTFTDSSNVLTRGSSNRLAGMAIGQITSGNYRLIDNWTAKDV